MLNFDSLTVLKRTKARIGHECDRCGTEIAPTRFYYKEYIENRFLHSLHGVKYCASSFEEEGEDLLNRRQR